MTLTLTRPAAAHKSAGASADDPLLASEISYAYSLDRETFRGRFESRREALAAARATLPTWPAAVEAIYVGRRIDPSLHVHGYAGLVLEAMRDRALDAGDAPADHDGLPAGARRDLDSRLARTLRDWVVGHDLLGEGRVEEISEHALPLTAHVSSGQEVEVGPVGVEG